MRRMSREIAIRAPVLPAETAAAASPDRTLSMAFHMEEPLPRRMAWAGLASMETMSGVWRTSLALAAAGARRSASAIAD